MNLLDINGIGIQFGGLKVLTDISFSIEKDEILGVIGPHGAGKTTLFNLITGFYKPTAGSITFDGDKIDGLNSGTVTKKGINRTFQNIRIFGSQTVLDNVLVGMNNKIDNSLFSSIFHTKKAMQSEREGREKAENLLEIVGLQDQMSERAENMSYGKQRRLELARALANEPKLLLLDEPTAGMNTQEAVQMIELIRSIHKMGMAILVIEHNMRVIMDLSDKIVVIEAGIKIAEGEPQVIQHDPQVIQAYLGADLD